MKKFENVVVVYKHFNNHFLDGEYPYFDGVMYHSLDEILVKIGCPLDIDYFYEEGGRCVDEDGDEWEGLY